MMRTTFLGKCGSADGDCPTLCATDRGSYLVQGWTTGRQGVVEIPHQLLGFAERDTFLGATLTDTGRGTFLVVGEPITDDETLSQLTLAEDETVVEVPKKRRSYYGAAATEQPVAQSVPAG
ncbi:hypothetical protein [Nocardia carnea]|nr:hypothetical protein [Nocardia carnea]